VNAALKEERVRDEENTLAPKEAEAISKIRGNIANAREGVAWEIRRDGLRSAEDGTYGQEGRGFVLREFETAISEADYEVLVVLDEDGRFIAARSDGDAGGVSSKGIDLTNRITTHNHPRGFLGFSVADVRSAIYKFERESRVVTPHGETVSLVRAGDEKMKEFSDMVKYRFHDGSISNTWLETDAEKYGYRFKKGEL
jgi:hypothetical protein